VPNEHRLREDLLALSEIINLRRRKMEAVK
jgi:hypothetical protein